MPLTRRELTCGLLAASATVLRGQVSKRPVPAFRPKPGGTQFVVYADSTSGRPGTRNELDLGVLNEIIGRLDPKPEYIVFPGDHIAGSADLSEHRRQWRHFLDKEMAWLKSSEIPVYHTTSNHNMWLPEHDAIFREVFPDIPKNGPAGEEGLAYWSRRGDVLVVAVNEHSPRLGYGRVETEWLDQVLTKNKDAAYKLVTGHLPVLTVNGYGFMNVQKDDGKKLWDLLAKHKVQAYLCSHVLAFDVQTRAGVLQLTTGCAARKSGGGLMPDFAEYPHFVQVALDHEGCRFQTIDLAESTREWGIWPVPEDIIRGLYWRKLEGDQAKVSEVLRYGPQAASNEVWFTIWRFSGEAPQPADEPQTLLAGFNVFRIVLDEGNLRLRVYLKPEKDGLIQRWDGPKFEPKKPFSFELMFYSGFGPGGILYRANASQPWESMESESAKGCEGMQWPLSWTIGHGQDGPEYHKWLGKPPVIEWSGVRSITKKSIS